MWRYNLSRCCSVLHSSSSQFHEKLEHDHIHLCSDKYCLHEGEVLAIPSKRGHFLVCKKVFVFTDYWFWTNCKYCMLYDSPHPTSNIFTTLLSRYQNDILLDMIGGIAFIKSPRPREVNLFSINDLLWLFGKIFSSLSVQGRKVWDLFWLSKAK